MSKGKTIICAGLYNTPLLDMATNQANLWWCYEDCLVKTDMTGRVLQKQQLQRVSTQGIVVKDDNLYLLTVTENSCAMIESYDTASMKHLNSLVLPDTKSPLGITTDGKHFFMIAKVDDSDTKILVDEYDAQFNFIKSHRLYTNSPVNHIKNIIFCYNHFYIARYSVIRFNGEIQNYTLLKYDRQFNHKASYDTYCGAGAVELTDNCILVGRAILKEFSGVPELNSLYAARDVRDQKVVAVSVKDSAMQSEKWAGIARVAKASDMGIDVIGPQQLIPPPFIKTPQDYFEIRCKYNVERNRTPYANVNWSKTEYILTSSHMHCRSQQTLDRAFERGLRFLTISNYYPAAPLYPITEKLFVEKWSMATDGMQPELNGKQQNLVDLIMDPEYGWQGELEPDVQRDLFAEQKIEHDFIIPDGIVEAPNAEHYDFTAEIHMHITTPGSTFSSGHFDSTGKYRFNFHGLSIGLGMDWPLVFDKIFDKLIFENGGGIVINHPMSWGPEQPGFDGIISMLDFDPRVMGIEIVNTGDDWSEDLWDSILATGRQCFGFFVPDHAVEVTSNWVGVNMLLTPAVTARDCLKAYRNGDFYGALYGNSIRFLDIHADQENVSVKTDHAACIEIITEKGVVHTINANQGSYQLPLDKQGKPDLIYLRIRAYEYADNKDYSKGNRGRGGYQGKGDVIFSQPIIYLIDNMS